MRKVKVRETRCPPMYLKEQVKYQTYQMQRCQSASSTMIEYTTRDRFQDESWNENTPIYLELCTILYREVCEQVVLEVYMMVNNPQRALPQTGQQRRSVKG
jgi:hypothetical protein